MLKQKRLSIRTKLILIYVLIAVPLMALLGISFYDRFVASRQEALNERRNIAQLSASNFTLFIDQISNAEVAIGGTIIRHELSVTEASGYLSNIATEYPVSNIAFLGPDGVVRAAARSDTIGQDRSAEPEFRTILRGGRLSVGNLRLNADGSPGFAIATAITEDGSLVGIVGMFINANRMDEVLGIQVTRGGVNIVDSEGNLVFQSQQKDILFDKRDWSDEIFVREALAGNTYTSTGIAFPVGGEIRMGTEIPIESLGWATGSFLPVNQVLAPIQQAALRSLLVALLVLAITLALAFVLGNRLVGGIITLQQPMEAATEAGFSERVMLETGDEIESLARSFNRMQDEILAAQRAQQQLQAEIEARNRELAVLYEQQKDVALTLQESLLPQLPHRLDGLEIGLSFHSATETALVGGDFFDFFEISEGIFGIVIGDVSGKGIEAAALAAALRNTLRAFAYDNLPPASVVEKVNGIAVIETPPSVFVTLFYGVLKGRELRLDYTNAGHWPPIIYSGDSRFVTLMASGPPLGVLPSATYTEYGAQIGPDSIMVLFTDGVVESRADTDLFGTSRLEDTIRAGAGLAPAQLAEHIIESAKSFGGGRLQDDAAVMAVKVVRRKQGESEA